MFANYKLLTRRRQRCDLMKARISLTFARPSTAMPGPPSLLDALGYGWP